eukprot:scaffold279167_cov24-Tisochrysis_lutea.AAC.1
MEHIYKDFVDYAHANHVEGPFGQLQGVEEEMKHSYKDLEAWSHTNMQERHRFDKGTNDAIITRIVQGGH